MASATRCLSRISTHATPFAANLRSTAARNARYSVARQPFQSSSRRGYASGTNGNNSRTGLYVTGLGLLALGGGLYYYVNGSLINLKEGSAKETRGIFTPKKDDYQKVYDAIAKLLEDKDDWDDGSYGPVILRLAWHCSGTFDKETGTGGSNGATMRFAPEGDHGANAGLKAARDFLDPVKRNQLQLPQPANAPKNNFFIEQFPWITYSDLWTLAGACAIQEMQGPDIPWRPGRQDRDVAMCTPDGRLPDATKEQSHLRAIFGRMGFDDREIVALSGAHALGRCHTDRSGFDGPWTFSPTVVTNDYYRLLLNEKWDFRKWNGPRQYKDVATKTLMMLPTDMALVKDKEFRKHVERYAKDNDVFFREFSDVIVKLFELGVPFTSRFDDRMTLKRRA